MNTAHPGNTSNQVTSKPSYHLKWGHIGSYITCHDLGRLCPDGPQSHIIMESSPYQTALDLKQATVETVSRISARLPAMSVSSVLVLLAITAIVFRALFQAYRSPLRDIPGPWLARFTRLWLLRAYASRSFQITNLNLHRKLGLIVSRSLRNREQVV